VPDGLGGADILFAAVEPDRGLWSLRQTFRFCAS
jgi:hypothetical protein